MTQTTEIPAKEACPESKSTPADTSGTTIYFAETLSGATMGALYTLNMLKAEMSKEAETMDVGGTVLNWAAVIDLVTCGLLTPHEDLMASLRSRATANEAVQ